MPNRKVLIRHRPVSRCRVADPDQWGGGDERVFLQDRSTIEAVFGGNEGLGWIVIGVATVALIVVARAGRNTMAQRPAALAG